MKNFWQKLNKSFIALAPMADVTDFAFRQMIAKYGKPDVMFTEFVSADGLASEKGRNFLQKELHYTEKERPIVAQIFGANPENIKIAVKIVKDLGFDGVDINMGCPDKAVIKQGAGAALMRTPRLAREIIRAAKEGAGKMPVSVKTRIGFNQNEIEKWLPQLLVEKPAAITIHGRTKKELSQVDAHWDVIARAVQIARGSEVLILGNGDVKNLDDAKEKALQSGVDGVMIGRGFFGKPDLLAKSKTNVEERLKLMLEHAELFATKMRGVKNYAVMKKHFKAYVSGWKGAKELRAALMETNDFEEVKKIVEEYLDSKTRN